MRHALALRKKLYTARLIYNPQPKRAPPPCPIMPSAINQPHIIDLDLAIIGGGVAGLWLINRAQKAGYQCALFEHQALGSDQTIASQGMIHGGMKYTLEGALSGASEAIAGMPEYWRGCLDGVGAVDLRQTKVLSDHFYLWSSETASSRLATFLASKLVRGRADPVVASDRPAALNYSGFKGSLYRLADIVLDVPSLLANLAQPVRDQLYQIDWSKAQLQLSAGGAAELVLQRPNGSLLVRAKRFIFSAGKGNAELLSRLGLTNPEMQVRPLHQVMVKHNSPFPFYGHCLGAETTPRLTISSHTTSDHQHLWYLGGSLAERGVEQSASEVIAAAQRELTTLMPWLDLKNAEWASHPVARAEPRQRNFARPDQAFAERAPGANNLLVAWPTKLTLVPNLAEQVFALLRADRVQPEAAPIVADLLRTELPHPRIAPTPWDIAFADAGLSSVGASSIGASHET